MRVDLHRHPDAPTASTVISVEADIARDAVGRMVCRYRIVGPTAAIAIAPPGPPERTDELWRSTCFELFLRSGEGGYLEFNFAPSCRWAAYRFDGYRTGMAPVVPFEAPVIKPCLATDELALECRLDLGGLAELAEGRPWRAALTAVVEERSGLKTYWSAAHGPGKPDFHHPDSFVVEIPVEGRS